ncbi:rCG39783, isoform CRA_b [Rattus norvegicus]|uniref:RCG39783, isoform CRA_b n=1 Tax=Rattus norvegicus TaxID=10116 RepID=A6I9N6_RAT|nr:rCG39783, isoform CRA_b [Rattus norvegicus]
MSQAGTGVCGNGGQEDSAAAGPFSFSPEPTLEDIRRLHAEFAAERDWEQFHQPRNLLLALVGEVGELAELFLSENEAVGSGDPASELGNQAST